MLALFTALKSKFAGVLAVAAVVVAVLFGVFRAGQRSATGDQVQKNLQEVQEKAKIHEEVARMPADARRDELREWAKR